MKNKKLLFLSLISFLTLVGCAKGNSQQTNGNGQENPPIDQNDDQEEDLPKIKEIALKDGAKNVLFVSEQMNTSTLFEIKANKGQTLKAADKKVLISSSNKEVIQVENEKACANTYLTALKEGKATITIASASQENTKLEVEIEVKLGAFDRSQLGFGYNDWTNTDMSHEVDETNPYIKTTAEEGVDHQFYFMNSYLTKGYVESEFTFYSEKDGTAHLPKFGFVFNTLDKNTYNTPGYSFICLDADSRNNNDTFYNIVYNEFINGSWGWDAAVSNDVAQCYTLYKHETGIKVGEKFKLGVLKDGFNLHIYLNDTYIKSVSALKDGFSASSEDLENPAPTIFGLFDFKAEVKYENYKFITDEEELAAKMPESPDFTDIYGDYTTPEIGE